MTVYILLRRYSDNSAVDVVGATTDRAIAQAFHAGGYDTQPHSEVYEVNINDPVRSTNKEYRPLDFDDEEQALDLSADQPGPATGTVEDDDIPF